MTSKQDSKQTPSTRKIPVVSSVAPFCQGRKALFVDIWGVMHNGIRPFAGAVTACQTFREAGGIVLLLSNAPRPKHSVAKQLDRIGVPADAYDAILSSGDAARQMIADLTSVPVLHIGPDRDQALFEECFGGTLTTSEGAKAIVCSGLYDDESETPEDYRAMLNALTRRNIPMICANPDLQVERGGKLIYCAGALAKLYQELGGSVRYAGKPHPPIYELALARATDLKGEPVTPRDVLAIGDGVHTDILGAGQAGIDAIFVASGVHVEADILDSAEVTRLFRAEPYPPVAAMQALVW